MTLRTAGLIAGALGVVLLLVGLIANWVKPASEATPKASLDTSVVVVAPEVLAISPDATLTISSKGTVAAHTARVQDVDAWVASRSAATITGLTDWDALTVKESEPAPSPSPASSPSPTASPAATASPSPTASPAPTASPSATPTPGPTPLGSQDIWRDTAQQDANYTVAAADVPVGLALVVEGLGDTQITQASLTMPRLVDDDWITQLIWWGVGLSVLGLIALVALFIDVRPAQTKGEEWLAYRSGIGSGKEAPKPGSRRARREAGAAIPVVEIPAEPTTGSTSTLTEASTDTPPMIAITRPGQATPAPFDAPPAPASAFEPPAEANEEGES